MGAKVLAAIVIPKFPNILGVYPKVFPILVNPRFPNMLVVFIPGGGFPPDARFLSDDCVIGNSGEADLGLPPGILRGS